MHYNTGMTKISDLKEAALPPAVSPDDSYFHIYVYRNDHGQEITGHTDIALGNTLVSYGCHDPQNRLPFCFKGDGVLIQADRTAFLNYAFIPGELMIDYALQPSAQQLHDFLSQSDAFFQHTIPWTPSGKEDYASLLYKAIHPSFYKLKDHKYTRYNLLHNNCVTFVNDCIQDWLPGYHARIETPASFRNFLNAAYEAGNPLFHARTIWYDPENK